MPHRLVSVAILLGWAVAAVALLRRDVLPDWLIGPPPNMRTVVEADAREVPTRWAILVASEAGKDPRQVGQITTSSHHRPDGDTSMRSDAYIDSSELLKDTPFAAAGGDRIKIGGDFVVDAVGDLNHFRAWVRQDGDGAAELLSLTGQIRGNSLEVAVRGALPLLNGPILGGTRTLPYRPKGLVQNELGPLDRMPGLQVGQRWESQVVNPITGRVQTGQVRVVRKFAITWDSNPVNTLEVETTLGLTRARTWVRPGDGLVLRQEVPVGLVNLVLERIPETPAKTSP